MADEIGTLPEVNWREYVPADVSGDPGLAKIVENMSEKDLPSLIKSHAHLTKRSGSTLNLPTKNPVSGFNADELTAFKQKVYEAGIFEAPPAEAKDYGITRPVVLPDGVGWSDELSNSFAGILHKHGATKALATDLLDLYAKALMGTQQRLNSNIADGRKQLEQEWGADYQARVEGAERLARQIFASDEEVEFFEKAGILEHPLFVGVLGRLAPLAEQDSSFFRDVGRGGGMTHDDVRAEVARIMTDKNHPDHEAYKRGDPRVQQKIQDLYRRIPGAQQVVDVGRGIKVEGRPE